MKKTKVLTIDADGHSPRESNESRRVVKLINQGGDAEKGTNT